MTNGSGRGGDISIVADEILISGIGGDFGGAASNVTADNIHTSIAGIGGSIRLDASTVTIADAGAVTAQTSNSGPAGDITISAQNTLRIEDSASSVSAGGVSTSAGVNAFGDVRGSAGEIRIDAPRVTLSRGRIAASAHEGAGAGTAKEGNLIINASDLVTLESSQITTSVITGVGGDVTISDAKSVLLDRSTIRAATKDGQGGNIRIAAGTGVVLEHSSILADATGHGAGGLIDIDALKLRVENGAEISTSTAGDGDAGLDHAQGR